MTSQHAYIAAAFFLGMSIALLLGQVFHAYLYEKIEPKPNFGTPSSVTLTNATSIPKDEYIPIQGIYYNVSTLKLMAVDTSHNIIEVSIDNIFIKKP